MLSTMFGVTLMSSATAVAVAATATTNINNYDDSISKNDKEFVH